MGLGGFAVRLGDLWIYEDEIRSVERCGCAEVGLAGGLEFAFARKREGRHSKEPPVSNGCCWVWNGAQIGLPQGGRQIAAYP